MRKRMKRKRRACRICKGHKRAQWVRWRGRDLDALRRSEREMRSAERY